MVTPITGRHDADGREAPSRNQTVANWVTAPVRSAPRKHKGPDISARPLGASLVGPERLERCLFTARFMVGSPCLCLVWSLG
jgi:hypothetical protein